MSSTESTPAVSFIGIVDFTEEAKWVYCSESCYELLGYQPHELIGRPSLELVHPEEFAEVKHMHYSTISQDQAAVLAYLRMKHKDPMKNYVLCAISRTVCQNVLVGSVSFASPGPKAMHNASTAQEVTIVTKDAVDFKFGRWNDPNPIAPFRMPPESPTYTPSSRSPSPSTSRSPTPENSQAEAVITFDPLPQQSVRTLFILDRFTKNCTIVYCSNDSIVKTTTVMGRPFFDFVAQKDEATVRSWIDVVKGWGVNERGQPSDGGFGYGKFTVCLEGRDSSHQAVPPPNRERDRPKHGARDSHRDAHPYGHSSAAASAQRPARRDHRPSDRPTLRRENEELTVDAIFSAHSDGLMAIIRQSRR